MNVSATQIKELREKTGAGVSDVKKALEESGGDAAKAFAALERKLGSSALKRAGRETRAGVIGAYVHSNLRIGVLVELLCETDFVARNPQFQELAHDIAMHIAAMSPQYLSLPSVPAEIWQEEKERIAAEVRKLGKSEMIVNEITDGKIKSYFGSIALFSQPFVKDPNKTVEAVVNEAAGKFGENIKIGKFTRSEL